MVSHNFFLLSEVAIPTMIRYTVAASVLLMAATATSSEIAIDGRGIFSTNRDAAMDGGRKLFSKVNFV